MKARAGMVEEIWQLAVEAASAEARTEAMRWLIPGPIRVRLGLAPSPAAPAGAFVVHPFAFTCRPPPGGSSSSEEEQVRYSHEDVRLQLRDRAMKARKHLDELLALVPRCPVMHLPHQRRSIESIAPPVVDQRGRSSWVASSEPSELSEESDGENSGVPASAVELLRAARACSSHGVSDALRSLAMLRAPLAAATASSVTLVDVLDDQGVTPLMLAAERGLADAVEFLLAARADVNAKASRWRVPGDPVITCAMADPPGDGWTALGHAAFAGRALVCQQLLRARAAADLALEPSSHHALDLAVQAGHSAVCGVLLDARADATAVASGATAAGPSEPAQHRGALHTTIVKAAEGGKRARNAAVAALLACSAGASSAVPPGAAPPQAEPVGMSLAARDASSAEFAADCIRRDGSTTWRLDSASSSWR